MVGLVLYAYATNERSARGIERHCRDDVAYRVITANVVPDHATIARFLVRHEQRLADLFASVLRLCDRAGLVESRVVAIDGTKMLANANRDRNVDYDRIAREILEEAKASARRTAPATQASVPRVITSSTPSRSLLVARAARAGGVKPDTTWSAIGGRRRRRFPGDAMSGCLRPAGGWRMSWPRRFAATTPTSTTERPGG